MYHIIGADGKEYGPVSADQLKQWLTEGRVNAQTRVKSETSPDWQPLNALPEFAPAFATTTTVPPPPMSAPVPGKTSGLAITSLVLGALGLFTCGITSLVGLVLGIIALVKISKSQGRLSGNGLAIAGVAMSGFFLLLLPVWAGMMLPALARAKQKAQAISCVSNMRQLTMAVHLYATEHGDLFPPAATWCDALQNSAGGTKVFQCPDGDQNKRSHYAFNARLGGVAYTNLSNPAMTVVFFETDGGWNLSGGPELMLNQSRHADLFVVGFADGHVEQVRGTRLSQLRWEPGTGSSP